MTSQVQEIWIKNSQSRTYKVLQEVVLEDAPLFNEQQIKVAVLSSLMLGQIWQFSLRSADHYNGANSRTPPRTTLVTVK